MVELLFRQIWMLAASVGPDIYFSSLSVLTSWDIPVGPTRRLFESFLKTGLHVSDRVILTAPQTRKDFFERPFDFFAPGRKPIFLARDPEHVKKLLGTYVPYLQM